MIYPTSSGTTQWLFFLQWFEGKNEKKTYTIIVTSVASPPTIVLGKGDYPTLFLSSTI